MQFGENEHLYRLTLFHVPLKTTDYSRKCGFTYQDTIAVNFEPELLSHGVADFPFFHVAHCVIGKTDLSQSKNKHKLIAISVAVEGRAGFMASSKLGLGAIRL